MTWEEIEPRTHEFGPEIGGIAEGVYIFWRAKWRVQAGPAQNDRHIRAYKINVEDGRDKVELFVTLWPDGFSATQYIITAEDMAAPDWNSLLMVDEQ